MLCECFWIENISVCYFCLTVTWSWSVERRREVHQKMKILNDAAYLTNFLSRCILCFLVKGRYLVCWYRRTTNRLIAKKNSYISEHCRRMDWKSLLNWRSYCIFMDFSDRNIKHHTFQESSWKHCLLVQCFGLFLDLWESKTLSVHKTVLFLIFLWIYFLFFQQNKFFSATKSAISVQNNLNRSYLLLFSKVSRKTFFFTLFSCTKQPEKSQWFNANSTFFVENLEISIFLFS